MSSSDRKLLEKELANFFGFDNPEDASDIFLLLTTIKSHSDLLEYLSSLLGPSSSATDDISRRTFVTNIQKWQAGEPIESSYSTSTSNQEEESVEQKYNVTKKDTKTKKSKQVGALPSTNTSSAKNKKSIKEARRKRATNPKNATSNSASITATPTQEPVRKNPPATKPKAVQKTDIKTSPDYATNISNLPQGKSEIICGCFGTFHKPSTNCLNCGRISCTQEEQNKFCPYCNHALIYPNFLYTIFGTNHIELEEAIQHKDKLLSYQEESKKRTEVYDDEKDYFSNKTSMWLTKEERLDSEQREEQRRKDLHERKKALLQDFISLKI